MYSKLPNLTLAFHGCDEKAFDAVIRQGEDMRPSRNDYDWLGSGVYFWEQNLNRAWSWAKEQQKRGYIEKPAVIGAVIDLGHCLNLLDSEYINLLSTEYKLLREEMQTLDLPLPVNEGKTQDKLYRKLDCAVIEHLHIRLEHAYKNDKNSLPPFDSVRALFEEGASVYPGAGFKSKTHIQLCVRNPNCIKGYFNPRETSKKHPIP